MPTKLTLHISQEKSTIVLKPRHALTEEIARQLSAYKHISVYLEDYKSFSQYQPQIVILVTKPSDRQFMISTITSPAFRQAKFFLVLLEDSDREIKNISMYLRNEKVDYQLLPFVPNTPLPLMAADIISRFIYGHPIPSVAAVDHKTQKETSADVKTFRRPSFRLPKITLKPRTVLLVLLLIYASYLFQIAALFGLLACGMRRIPGNRVCLSVTEFLSGSLELQTHILPGSKYLIAAAGLSPYHLFSATHSLSRGLSQINRSATVAENTFRKFLGGGLSMDQVTGLELELSQTNNVLAFLQTELRLLYLSSSRPPRMVAEWTEQISGIRENFSRLLLVYPNFPHLLSIDSSRRYLVLLADNTRLSPMGGPVIGLLLVQAQNGSISDLQYYDVKTLEDKFTGQAAAPPDFIRAGNQNWSLSQVTWYPDFGQTATTAAWFVEKTISVKPDVIISANHNLFINLLNHLGPIQLSGTGSSVSRETYLSQFLAARKNGSAGRYLGEVVRGMQSRLTKITPADLTQLIIETYKLLDQRQIAVYPAGLSGGMSLPGWGGELGLPGCRSTLPCLSDYFYPVHTSLDTTAEDHNLTSETDILTAIESELIRTRYRIILGPSQSEATTERSGFLRIFIPASASISAFVQDGQVLEPSDYLLTGFGKLKQISLPYTLSAGSRTGFELNVSQPVPNNSRFRYQFDLPNQPGLGNSRINFHLTYPDDWFATTYSSARHWSPRVATAGSLEYNGPLTKPFIVDFDITVNNDQAHP